jgi:hypothetical protein
MPDVSLHTASKSLSFDRPGGKLRCFPRAPARAVGIDEAEDLLLRPVVHAFSSCVRCTIIGNAPAFLVDGTGARRREIVRLALATGEPCSEKASGYDRSSSCRAPVRGRQMPMDSSARHRLHPSQRNSHKKDAAIPIRNVARSPAAAMKNEMTNPSPSMLACATFTASPSSSSISTLSRKSALRDACSKLLELPG